MLDQRLGDRSGTWPEFDHRSVAMRIDILRHRAGERLARRCDGADCERLLDPGSDEPHLVVEAHAVLALEAADLGLDVAADLPFDAAERLLHLFLERLLEKPDPLLDILAYHLLEKLDPLFELFKRLHGHRG